MGGVGSGLNRTNPNGATISAIDEARWRLVDAEENAQKCSQRVGWAYHHLRLAEAEVKAAIADLARLQRSLGDNDLTDREVNRVEGFTVSNNGTAELVESIHRTVREKRATA